MAQFIEPIFFGFRFIGTPTLFVGVQFIEPVFAGAINVAPTLSIVGVQFIEPVLLGVVNVALTVYKTVQILSFLPMDYSEHIL